MIDKNTIPLSQSLCVTHDASVLIVSDTNKTQLA